MVNQRSVPSVLAAVESLLSEWELDAMGNARAALARLLAAKLDQVRSSEVAQAALAVPGISRELREVLDAIQEQADDNAEFVAGLFAPVGDSTKR